MSAAVPQLTADERQRLVAAALAARPRAYAPYSNFQVGAAVLAASGEIVTGANVENASYGLTVCAERVAIHAAVARGLRELRAIAVATSGGLTPCGACRQVMAEFCAELLILLVDADLQAEVKEARLSELLPQSFRLDKA